MSKLLEEGKSLNYDTPTAQGKRKPQSKAWDMIQVAGILGCFVFIGVQMYSNFGAGLPRLFDPGQGL